MAFACTDVWISRSQDVLKHSQEISLKFELLVSPSLNLLISLNLCVKSMLKPGRHLEELMKN